jgi:hypothetical protein
MYIALADAQAEGESSKRQEAARSKALEDLQKQVPTLLVQTHLLAGTKVQKLTPEEQLVAVTTQKEEAERSLSAAVWRECAADGNRKLELREAEEARALERGALQKEQQRAVRADATANALLAQV